MRRIGFWFVLCASLHACSNTANVPVRDGALTAIVPPITAATTTATAARMYTVEPGDTLYSIAWNFNADYRDLAASNNIAPPYILTAGQTLQLFATKAANSGLVTTESTGVQLYAVDTPTFVDPAVVQNTLTPTPSMGVTPARSTSPAVPVTPTASGTAITNKIPTAPTVQQPVATKIQWHWPAKGQVIRGFSKQNNGIDIAGKRGDPIYAVAEGQVVYSGTGLRGYGQLIIIKHSPEFLSAYAHNSVVQVAEGDLVRQGQKIAEMGDTGTNRVKLHFELRLRGKPVDPQKYLPG